MCREGVWGPEEVRPGSSLSPFDLLVLLLSCFLFELQRKQKGNCLYAVFYLFKCRSHPAETEFISIKIRQQRENIGSAFIVLNYMLTLFTCVYVTFTLMSCRRNIKNSILKDRQNKYPDVTWDSDVIQHQLPWQRQLWIQHGCRLSVLKGFFLMFTLHVERLGSFSMFVFIFFMFHCQTFI